MKSLCIQYLNTLCIHNIVDGVEQSIVESLSVDDNGIVQLESVHDEVVVDEHFFQVSNPK